MLIAIFLIAGASTGADKWYYIIVVGAFLLVDVAIIALTGKLPLGWMLCDGEWRRTNLLTQKLKFLLTLMTMTIFLQIIPWWVMTAYIVIEVILLIIKQRVKSWQPTLQVDTVWWESINVMLWTGFLLVALFRDDIGATNKTVELLWLVLVIGVFLQAVITVWQITSNLIQMRTEVEEMKTMETMAEVKIEEETKAVEAKTE